MIQRAIEKRPRINIFKIMKHLDKKVEDSGNLIYKISPHPITLFTISFTVFGYFFA